MKTKIDEKMFRAVKIMLNGGASTQEVVDYLQISAATTGRIRASETFEEYQAILAAMGAKIKAYNAKKKAEAKQDEAEVKPVEQPAEKPPVAPTLMNQAYLNNRVYELMKEQNELLKLLSNKLAYIVDQLC